MSLLSVKGVSKFYEDHTALNNLNLEVKQGATFGLLGPNGAGKTSLIRIINQITGPDKGEILLNGERLKPEHIGQIGYLPEERGLYPKMKVGEQLLYLAQLKNLSKAEAKKRVREWLIRFEADSWWDKNIEELSKGMAQKVQFIATVIHQPELLILDEPFTGFDPINANLIKSEILRLRDEGATIIFSTHRMESVEEICDDIVLMNQGEKILEGELQQIKKDNKSGIILAQIENTPKIEKIQSGEIISQEIQNHNLCLRLKAKGNTNAVAQELLQLGTLLSFTEETPSLNEIFIQKIQA